ncbi:MAG: glycine dehydrogenase (aminomethyl-transferring), partial [Cyanobacteriota bacterium]|nr:glycine dehydrogenase (aminomethyl-transferring) [Cyanobacteriota bacterium]
MDSLLPAAAARPDFARRHLGPGPEEQRRMLAELGLNSLEHLAAQVVPADILLSPEQACSGLPEPCDEATALAELAAIASGNRVVRSLIGQGYYGTATPALLQRHVFENPAWYTAYTPYQAEIAQGRLEALLNFQTLISELTGLPISNASLLDEATAAAEAMALARAVGRNRQASRFLVDRQVFPQTLAVLHTRAEPLGITLELVDAEALATGLASGAGGGALPEGAFGLLLQLPGNRGRLWNPEPLLRAAADAGLVSVVAIDPLAQVLLAPVGELGADIAIGSAQRFGVPMGFGGPHAAFFATRQAYQRQIPGRLVGQSRDAEGQPALRLALQTREQHIRRDKATSNICTAQVLLAVMASFYAVHHGPEGLTAIAVRVAVLRQALASGLAELGLEPEPGPGFGTLVIPCGAQAAPRLLQAALAGGFNLRPLADGVGISLDECSTAAELEQLLTALAQAPATADDSALTAALDACRTQLQDAGFAEKCGWQKCWAEAGVPHRQGHWLGQEVFHRYRSETELLRYIQRLVSRDLSLVHGMIPLGSCTMKLNAAAELAPVSWPAFSQLHPFAPADQAQGYRQLAEQLEGW